MLQSTCAIETGLSDFHLMTVIVIRKTFKKIPPRIINYRSFKHFSNKTFRISLESNLSKELYINDDDGLEKFCKTTMDTLNKIASIKKKHVRGYQMPIMIRNFQSK